MKLGRVLVASGAMGVGTLRAVAAQGVVDRPPVVSGDWVGVPGIVYFNFVHRFSTSSAPERKVTNVPTFLVAAGLPWHTLVGANYATNSALVTRYPNEHEYLFRVAPLGQRDGAPLDVGVQVDYNDAARGADGEVSAARTIGPLRLIGAGRMLTDPTRTGHAQTAIAGGAVVHLGSYLAISGDAGSVMNRAPAERVAWSAGLQLQLPLTPHTLSLQATNVNAATLQGSSRGTTQTRYGFEFTIPLTLRRYIGRRASPSDAVSATSAPTSAPGAIVRIQGLAFHDGHLEVAAGTTVEWRNDDPLAHTVTFRDGSVSSPLIEPGHTWRHTFEKPGTYAFYCTPHPFMQGTVVVR
jgi:plastocyanin